MFHQRKSWCVLATMVLSIQALLFVACGDVTPTTVPATALPATAVPATTVPATPTTIPATSTPIPPTFTATAIPPTSTPSPTPDLVATATAKALVQATADAKSTADAQATIAALPKPINLTGTGSKVVKDLQLGTGVIKLDMLYKGQGNFIVKLLDANGRLVALSANTIGNYKGSQYASVKNSGNYAIQVESSGPWNINLEITEIILQNVINSVPPGPYRGSGDTASAVKVTKAGLAVFKMTHAGKRNFIVTLVRPKDGSSFAFLANQIGKYSGEKAESLDAGEYLVNIQADGEWTIEVS